MYRKRRLKKVAKRLGIDWTYFRSYMEQVRRFRKQFEKSGLPCR